jgi:tRNA threonylcarbamoyl adenosine modification protein YjeE
MWNERHTDADSVVALFVPRYKVRRMAEKSSGFQGGLLVRSLAETEDLARRIAPGLRAGDAVALKGELGVGKTTLARAILRALGVDDEVPSPSFTLVQEYETAGLRILHCDLYRITDCAELAELGIEEALCESAVLIEWPERAQSRIPHNALWIEMEISGESERRMAISGPERWSFLRDGNGAQ